MKFNIYGGKYLPNLVEIQEILIFTFWGILTFQKLIKKNISIIKIFLFNKKHLYILDLQEYTSTQSLIKIGI